jgi:hypothetical protein
MRDNFERTCYTYAWLGAFVWIIAIAGILGLVAGLFLGWQLGLAIGLLSVVWLTIEAWRGMTRK